MRDAYYAATLAFNTADLDWHHAIIAEFGAHHGIDARYDGRARGEIGSPLREAHDRREAARLAWERVSPAACDLVALPDLTCRKCDRRNPGVYLAPVVMDGSGTCICMECADARGWLDKSGNLQPGVTV